MTALKTIVATADGDARRALRRGGSTFTFRSEPLPSGRKGHRGATGESSRRIPAGRSVTLVERPSQS